MKFLAQLGSLLSGNRVSLSDRFQILSEAVNGTMSNFHRALDKKHNKMVGLKILDSEKTQAFESRFKLLKKPSEGEIGLALKHPRVVETYETGMLTDGRKYILMEYIEGMGLNSLIKMGSKSLDGNRYLLIEQMAEAVEAVHKAGFIHRDICPRNFIVAADGMTLKLIDFGLTLPDEPAFRQPGDQRGRALGDAVSLRPAPFGPIAGRRPDAGQDEQRRAEDAQRGPRSATNPKATQLPR